jgi:hypothetical protein
MLSDAERADIIKDIMAQNEVILAEHRKKLELEVSHCVTALLHHYTTTLLHHCTVVPLHHCSLYHYDSTLLYHCPITPLHHCTTALPLRHGIPHTTVA